MEPSYGHKGHCTKFEMQQHSVCSLNITSCHLEHCYCVYSVLLVHDSGRTRACSQEQSANSIEAPSPAALPHPRQVNRPLTFPLSKRLTSLLMIASRPILPASLSPTDIMPVDNTIARVCTSRGAQLFLIEHHPRQGVVLVRRRLCKATPLVQGIRSLQHLQGLQHHLAVAHLPGCCLA